jgi:hypothetical protein
MFFSEITINARAVARLRNYRSITSSPSPVAAATISATCKLSVVLATAGRKTTLILGSIGVSLD